MLKLGLTFFFFIFVKSRGWAKIIFFKFLNFYNTQGSEQKYYHLRIQHAEQIFFQSGIPFSSELFT